MLHFFLWGKMYGVLFPTPGSFWSLSFLKDEQVIYRRCNLHFSCKWGWVPFIGLLKNCLNSFWQLFVVCAFFSVRLLVYFLSICWNSEYIKEVVCFTCKQFIPVYHLLLDSFDSVFLDLLWNTHFIEYFSPSTIMGLFFIPESLPASSEALKMLCILFI